MNVIKLMKKFLATLLLAFVVVAMVPACSTTEESGGGESFNECTAKGESSDLDCREDCT
jgi:hypothetical protein